MVVFVSFPTTIALVFCFFVGFAGGNRSPTYCMPLTWEDAYHRAFYVGLVKVRSTYESERKPGFEENSVDIEYTFKGNLTGVVLNTVRHMDPSVRYIIATDKFATADYCNQLSIRENQPPSGPLRLVNINAKLLNHLYRWSNHC